MDFNSFLSQDEEQISAGFLTEGYHRFPLAHPQLLEQLRALIHGWAMEILQLDPAPDVATFFDQTHQYVTVAGLNSFRMELIRRLTASTHLKTWLYHLAKEPLHLLVGNELAMQRALNLSIQLPEDTSSILPLHSDVWSGNSPYEVVFWLPLVDCYRTRSMYVLPRVLSDPVLADFKRYSALSAEAFYQELESQVQFVDVPLGQGLIFSHSIIHGNRINQEGLSRWSMNIRFKSLLSPYGSKEVGESFLPITVRPATRIGYAYREPIC